MKKIEQLLKTVNERYELSWILLWGLLGSVAGLFVRSFPKLVLLTIFGVVVILTTSWWIFQHGWWLSMIAALTIVRHLIAHENEIYPRLGAMGAWALRNGAATFCLAVLTENAAACGLYQKLGMVKVGQYHYRKKEV